MRPVYVVGLLLVAAGCASESPSSPTNLQRVFTLELQLSSDCPTAQIGPAVYQAHRFVMQGGVTNAEWIFKQEPLNNWPVTTPFGVVLRLIGQGRQLTGSLSGSGLAADASYLYSVGENFVAGPLPNGVIKGMATVRGEGTPGIEPVGGYFAGYVAMSTYGLNAATACTASDHTWRLLPY